MEILNRKEENQALKAQKKELLEKSDLNDISQKELVYKPDVRILMCFETFLAHC